MKLLVIILCLISERYLIHSISTKRFFWFPRYVNLITQKFRNHGNLLGHQLLNLGVVVLPVWLICATLFYALGSLFWGTLGFLFHLVIFYYCLGPENPFYPERKEEIKEASDKGSEIEVGKYFARVNGSLFTVIFLYVVLGPLGILFYRLVALSQAHLTTALVAKKITEILEWLPARITALTYLLVGNFQKGIFYLGEQFFSKPQENPLLLERIGLLAARSRDDEIVSMPQAENLVIHALTLYLFCLAVCTLIAWL